MLCLVLLSGGCSDKAGSEKQPDNVILISIDTLRWDHCSVYGYKRNTTPTLKKLAKRGVCFSSAYAPTSTTAPSHATMLTSLYPITHGIVVHDGTKLDPKFETLAEHLADSGYQTAAIVSSFVLDSKFGFSQGFDFYDDNLEKAYETMPLMKEWHGNKVVGGFDQCASETTRKTIKWLSEQRSDKQPFFLFLHFMDPHHPYAPPQPYASEFPTDMIGRYDGEVAYIDDSIKKIFEELKRLKLDDNTLIVITSDHGEGLMQHGWRSHGRHLYDEGVRVPLIFYWPGHILKGRMFAEPVDLLTLAPTILDLLDIKRDGCKFAGKSLKSTLCEGAAPSADHPIYMQSRDYGTKKWGVRVGDWKYIEDFSGKKKELFNMIKDPAERVNSYIYSSKKGDELALLLAKWKRLYTQKSTEKPMLSEEDRLKFQSLGYLTE